MTDQYKTGILGILTGAFLLYTMYLYFDLPIKTSIASVDADHGKQVWQKYNCVACHQVYGLGGFLGPDLTNSYSLRGEEYLKAFIRGGTATMPAFHLADHEMHALIAYLRELDNSGSADPRSFTILNNGSIEQRK